MKVQVSVCWFSQNSAHHGYCLTGSVIGAANGIECHDKTSTISAFYISVWCNGNTSDSDSGVRGSKPCAGAK